MKIYLLRRIKSKWEKRISGNMEITALKHIMKRVSEKIIFAFMQIKKGRQKAYNYINKF